MFKEKHMEFNNLIKNNNNTCVCVCLLLVGISLKPCSLLVELDGYWMGFNTLHHPAVMVFQQKSPTAHSNISLFLNKHTHTHTNTRKKTF